MKHTRSKLRCVGKSDDEGSFTLTNLPAGEIELCAGRNGTLSGSTYGETTKVKVTDGEVTDGIELRANSNIQLTGVVLDFADKTPVVGARLMFEQDGIKRAVTTDVNGEFAVRVKVYGGALPRFAGSVRSVSAAPRVPSVPLPAGSFSIVKQSAVPSEQFPPPLPIAALSQTPNYYCDVTMIEPGMQFVVDGAMRMVQQRIVVESPDVPTHVELFADTGVPCLSGRVILPADAGYAAMVSDQTIHAAYQTERGMRECSAQINQADSTYNLLLPEDALLTKVFLVCMELGYAQMVPLTGKKTEYDLVGEAASIRAYYPYTMLLSDGAPLLQDASDNFGADVIYYGDDDMMLSPMFRSQSFGADGKPQMMLKAANWHNTAVRLSLPDGFGTTKPIALDRMRNKLTKFIYDPVKKDITIEYSGQ